MKKMSKEEFARMIEKEMRLNSRLCELLNGVMETLSSEFDICYSDAEYEIAKWGQERLDEDD